MPDKHTETAASTYKSRDFNAAAKQAPAKTAVLMIDTEAFMRFSRDRSASFLGTHLRHAMQDIKDGYVESVLKRVPYLLRVDVVTTPHEED